MRGDKEYREGVIAYNNDKTLEDNPYTGFDQIKMQDWFDGYYDCMDGDI